MESRVQGLFLETYIKKEGKTKRPSSIYKKEINWLVMKRFIHDFFLYLSFSRHVKRLAVLDLKTLLPSWSGSLRILNIGPATRRMNDGMIVFDRLSSSDGSYDNFPKLFHPSLSQRTALGGVSCKGYCYWQGGRESFSRQVFLSYGV